MPSKLYCPLALQKVVVSFAPETEALSLSLSPDFALVQHIEDFASTLVRQACAARLHIAFSPLRIDTAAPEKLTGNIGQAATLVNQCSATGCSKVSLRNRKWTVAHWNTGRYTVESSRLGVAGRFVSAGYEVRGSRR